ncbi:MAG TPA: hypothetical protein VG870_00875 [Chitinophagaceae bacterium]|nr:hypothetical protein [Chitinophagaceae bacterium]
MKRLIFIATLALPVLTLRAQEPADALRYSWVTPGGTAREQAIGGAMGSLGGDLSAAYVNPAGLGMYKTGDVVFSPGFNFLANRGTYYDRTEKDHKNQFVWGATGFVMGWGNGNNGRKLRSSAFSMAVNRLADFNSNILYRGSQNQSSFSQKFLEEIQNNNDHDANHVASSYPFGTSLALNTYWIDTVAGGSAGNYQFQTRSPIATGLLQQNTLNSKGGITEFAMAGAANISDKFYYGATLGIPILRYERTTEFLEADATDNPNNQFNYAAFSDHLKTTGVGVNLKAGILYKPADFLRLGLAFHSPTYYSLEDKYDASITTDTEGYQGLLTQSSNDLIGGPSDFKYALVTPYRVIASASYVFRESEDVTQQRGFVTADVEYINYKASSFHQDAGASYDQSTKDYLKQLNTAIDNAYKGAINLRVGGELKFTTFMVRAGGAYYGNPYKNLHGEKGSHLQLTGGLGYRNKGLFIDLAYVQNINRDTNFPYRLQYAPFQGARIKGSGGNVILTFGFKI